MPTPLDRLMRQQDERMQRLPMPTAPPMPLQTQRQPQRVQARRVPRTQDAPPLPGGPLTTFAHSAREAVVPFAAGIGGAKVGAKVGAALGSAAGPVGSAVGGVAGALAGGVAGAAVGGQAQEAALRAAVGRERREQTLRTRQAQREAHPVASFLGETAPFLATFRPSLTNLQRTGDVLRKVSSPSRVRQLSRRPQGTGITSSEAAVAADVVGGAAVGTAAEAARQVSEGSFSPLRLAAEGALGAVFTDPNRLGQRAGLQAHPSQRESQVQRILQQIDRRRREGGRERLAGPERQQVMETAARRVGAAQGQRTPERPPLEPLDEPRLPSPDAIGQPEQPRWRQVGTQARERLTAARTRTSELQTQAQERIQSVRERLAQQRTPEQARQVERVERGERPPRRTARRIQQPLSKTDLTQQTRTALRERGMDIESRGAQAVGRDRQMDEMARVLEADPSADPDRLLLNVLRMERHGDLHQSVTGRLAGLPASQLQRGDDFTLGRRVGQVIAADENDVTIRISHDPEYAEGSAFGSEQWTFTIPRDRSIPANRGSFHADEGPSRVQQARQSERAIADAETAVRQRIAAEAERLPEHARGQLLQTIASARTPAQMRRAIDRVDRILDRVTVRDTQTRLQQETRDAARTAAHEALQDLPRGFRVQAQRTIDRTENPDVMLRAAEQAIDRYERNHATDVVHRLLNQERRRREKGAQMTPDALQIIRDAAGDIDPKPLTKRERHAAASALRHLRRQPDAMLPQALKTDIDRLLKRDIRELSTDELLGVADAIRTARHVNRNQLTSLAEGQESRANLVGNAIEREVSRAKPSIASSTQRLMERVFKQPTRPNQYRSVGSLARQTFARPETVFANMSERLRSLVYEQIGVEGYDRYLRANHQMRDGLADVFRQAGQPMGTREFEQWQRRRVATAEAGELTPAERIHLATVLKDPDNLEVAVKQGVIPASTGNKVVLSRATATALARGDMLDGVERTASDWMFQQYNTSLRDMLNSAWRREYGVDIARGNMAPRSVESPEFSIRADPSGALGAFRNNTLQTWSHLKRREGAGTPIQIGSGLDYFLNHADFVSRIHAYLSPVNDALKVLQRDNVRGAIRDRYGDVGYNGILRAIQMQTVPTRDQSSAETTMRRLMRNYGAATLGVRLSTMLVNPSGLFIAAPYLGWGNVARALRMAPNPREHQRIAERARRHSAYYAERYDRNYGSEAFGGMAEGVERQYGRMPISEIGMEPIKWSDQFGGNIRWAAAENRIAQLHPDMDRNSDEFGRLVAREWEKAMYRSENTGHGMEMSGALAAGRRNPWMSPFLIFQSTVSKVFSGGVRGIDLIRQGEVQQGMNHLAGYIGSIAFTVAVREMLAEGRGTMDAEDRQIGQRALRVFAESAGHIPILGQEVLAPAVRSIGNGRFWTFEPTVYDVLHEGGRGVSELLNTLPAAYQSLVDEHGQTVAQQRFASSMERFANVVSRFVGFPLDGPRDAARIIRNMTEGLPANNRRDILSLMTKEVDALAREDGQLTSAQQREASTNANNQIFRALRSHAPGQMPDASAIRWFHRGIEQRVQAGLPVDRNTLRSMVEGRYAQHTRIARDENQVSRLPANARNMLMDVMHERDILLAAIDDLMSAVDAPVARR